MIQLYNSWPVRLGWPLCNICVTNDHGYVRLEVNTSRSFPRSWLITGFVTRLAQRVSFVKQELLIFSEHMSSPPVFSGVPVTRSSFLYVCLVDRCLSFCTFPFGYCVVCSSSIYGFFWYLQILLRNVISASAFGKCVITMLNSDGLFHAFVRRHTRVISFVRFLLLT